MRIDRGEIRFHSGPFGETVMNIRIGNRKNERHIGVMFDKKSAPL